LKESFVFLWLEIYCFDKFCSGKFATVAHGIRVCNGRPHRRKVCSLYLTAVALNKSDTHPNQFLIVVDINLDIFYTSGIVAGVL